MTVIWDWLRVLKPISEQGCSSDSSMNQDKEV